MCRTPMLCLDSVEEQQNAVLGQNTKKNTYFGQKMMKSPKKDILHHISQPHHGTSESAGNKL